MTYTLVATVSFQEEIRKSRFAVWAAPVQSAHDAAAFIAAHSDPAATHNCWAWKVGQAYRFNDDGEPTGTAGKPILQAIEGQQLDEVAVLVVRWFGGIKLGTGGLVRAYGGAAAQCLRQAEKIQRVEKSRVDCEVRFSHMALVQSRLAGYGAVVVAETFNAQGVCWQLEIPVKHLAAFTAEFANLTRGQGSLDVATGAN